MTFFDYSIQPLFTHFDIASLLTPHRSANEPNSGMVEGMLNITKKTRVIATQVPYRIKNIKYVKF